MNIVVITTGSRPDLLKQTMLSLVDNATDNSQHRATLVVDGSKNIIDRETEWFNRTVSTLIVNSGSQGASAARNIGASSIPTYRRQKYVMFLDDDVFMCPKWDEVLTRNLDFLGLGGDGRIVLSGHAHPYNHALGTYMKMGENDKFHVDAAGVLSTVHMAMPWSIWDDVGFFCEPGGPGGSEDVEWCARATAKGYGLAVTATHCVLHCGLSSSMGKQIVGYDLMVQQNERLVKEYGLEGTVQWA